jgi:hypothetical protein
MFWFASRWSSFRSPCKKKAHNCDGEVCVESRAPRGVSFATYPCTGAAHDIRSGEKWFRSKGTERLGSTRHCCLLPVPGRHFCRTFIMISFDVFNLDPIHATYVSASPVANMTVHVYARQPKKTHPPTARVQYTRMRTSCERIFPARAISLFQTQYPARANAAPVSSLPSLSFKYAQTRSPPDITYCNTYQWVSVSTAFANCYRIADTNSGMIYAFIACNKCFRS